MQLTYYGVITNSSGEDWKEVLFNSLFIESVGSTILIYSYSFCWRIATWYLLYATNLISLKGLPTARVAFKPDYATRNYQNNYKMEVQSAPMNHARWENNMNQAQNNDFALPFGGDGGGEVSSTSK
jgi:hypothetical protein